MSAETYGQKVARLRGAKGWTQDDLVRESGVPRRTLQNIETDAVDRPHRKNVLAINQALGIEGDPELERATWPRDVQLFLDMMGAYLMTKDPEDRLELMSTLTRRVYVGDL